MARFSRDVVRTLATQMVMIALALGVGVLTARALGPELRGVFSLCMSISTTAVLFASFEIGQSMVYHTGRERIAASAVVGGALPLIALLGAGTCLLLLTSWPLFARAFDALPRTAFTLAALIVPLALAGGALRQVFRALDRFDLYNVHRALVPSVRLVLLATTFALGGGLVGALWAVLASEALLLVYALVSVARAARPRLRDGIRCIRPLFRFGARVEASSALGYASARLPLFAAAYFLAPEQIAFFAIADALTAQTYTIPQVVGTVLLPKIAQTTDGAAADMTAASHRATTLLTVGIVLIIALVSQPLVIGLYGDAYAPALWPLLAVLPGAVFRAGARVIAPYMIATNHVRVWIGVLGTALVVQAVLLWICAPRWGVVGVAAACSAAFLVQWLLALASFRKIAGVPLRRALVVDAADVQRLVDAARSSVGAPSNAAR